MSDFDFRTIEAPISSTCNLDCKYCYIPKNRFLIEKHKEWSKIIDDGVFYELISTGYRDVKKISYFSLWGGEPTIGFKNIFKDIDKTKKYFFNIKDFNTSTNLTLVDEIIKTLIKLNDVAKKNKEIFSVSIQVSIDGQKYITDRNRGEGVFEKVYNGLFALANFLANNSLENITVSLHSKATHDTNDYLYFLENKNNFIEYINLFIRIEENLRSILKDTKNVNYTFYPTTSLAVPGKYTTEDGRIFADFVKFEYEVKKEMGVMQSSMYYERLKTTVFKMKKLYENIENSHALCSAGNAAKSIDPDGTSHYCHSSWWLNYEDYVGNISGLMDWEEGRRVLPLEFNVESTLRTVKTITADLRDDLNIKRVEYIIKEYNNNFASFITQSMATLKSLGLAKQVSKIYTENQNYALLFSMFLLLTNACWANNKLATNLLTATPISMFRIFCNGAFEFFVEKLIEEKKSIHDFTKNKKHSINNFEEDLKFISKINMFD